MSAVNTVEAIETLVAHGTTPANLAGVLANADRGQLVSAGAAALGLVADIASLLGRNAPVFGIYANLAGLATGGFSRQRSTTKRVR